MAEWRKDLSKNAIHLAAHNKVVADIVVAADNKALALELDIAVAADNKKLVADKKIAAHNLVVKNMPVAVGDNNNLVQYGPER